MDISIVRAAFVGKTVKSFEVIEAEYGRTYQHYLLFTFTDESRFLLVGSIGNFSPRPSIDEMRKAPLFYSPEDIAARVLEEEILIRRRRADERKRMEQQLERLRKELDNT